MLDVNYIHNVLFMTLYQLPIHVLGNNSISHPPIAPLPITQLSSVHCFCRFKDICNKVPHVGPQNTCTFFLQAVLEVWSTLH